MTCRWQSNWSDFCSNACLTRTSTRGAMWSKKDINGRPYPHGILGGDYYVCRIQCQAALMLRGGTGDTGFHVMDEPCGVETKCYEAEQGAIERFANIAGDMA